MESELGFFLCKFKDLRATFSKVKKGSILDEIELFEIKSFSKLCNDISIEYSKTGIDVDAICFRDVKPVFRILDPDPLCQGDRQGGRGGHSQGGGGLHPPGGAAVLEL